MSTENLFASIKENLNGRPGQPMLFGVCKALAARFDQEPWVFRAVAIVLGVVWTGLTLILYVALGLLLPETSERTQGVFRGLGIWLREVAEKVIGCFRGLGGHAGGRNGGATR